MSIGTATLVYTGQGNLRSLRSALQHVGVTTKTAETPADIESAATLILPGVSSTAAIVTFLADNGQWEAVRAYAQSGRRLLGVCAGMQILATACTEGGEHTGLEALTGSVVKIDKHPGLRVPHVGWSPVRRTSEDAARWFPEGDYYFTHSYSYVSADGHDVVAATTGDFPVTAAVQHGECFAVQFHPEKSQELGLAFLDSWKRSS